MVHCHTNKLDNPTDRTVYTEIAENGFIEAPATELCVVTYAENPDIAVLSNGTTLMCYNSNFIVDDLMP